VSASSYQVFSEPLLSQVSGGSETLKQFAAFRLWAQQQEAELEEMLEAEWQTLAPTYEQLAKLPEYYREALREKLDEEYEGVVLTWSSQCEQDIADEFVKLLQRLGYVISGNFFDCNLKISGGVELDDRTLELIRQYERALCSAAPQDAADLTPKGLKALEERDRVLREAGMDSDMLASFCRHTGPIRYDQQDDERKREGRRDAFTTGC
jgi:hypothetical protein